MYKRLIENNCLVYMLFILGNVFNSLKSVSFLIDNMYIYFH